MHEWVRPAQPTTVIARLVRDCALGRATQYSRDISDLWRGRGVLGHPPSRVTTGGAGTAAQLTARPYAFFFTSLTFEKLMPSARSRV
ncbi:hypothetical protein SAMN05444171_6975 [Bradyrhizobium lablabi]|uniref:Uncharacterized protein n=2 Tax=Bradyrhizobium TaxID=374 RepID=A0ABY0P9Y0_9BRAD|nr:hypothetical protein SAMN05444163_0193 [Bradyrhizobium ottawaense]SEE30605.1 hypothetical protein SAMN05444171_6975 [Bradyrhizobium lablabi]SHM26910.1 hypothetical protein SAMN05444321_5782 [Bradyrhizobium lablabi]